MFIEEITEFKMRSPGPPGCTCNAKIGYFRRKKKISKENKSSSVLLLTVKHIAKGNVRTLLPFTWTKSNTRFIKNMLRFKREFKYKED